MLLALNGTLKDKDLELGHQPYERGKLRIS